MQWLTWLEWMRCISQKGGVTAGPSWHRFHIIQIPYSGTVIRALDDLLNTGRKLRKGLDNFRLVPHFLPAY